MPRFHYEVLTAAGEFQAGISDAASQSKVTKELHSRGVWPIRVEEISKKKRYTLFARNPIHLTAAQLISFFSGLSTLLGAGLSLEQALSMLGKTPEKGGNFTTIQTVLKHVRGGSSLSLALSKAQEFPQIAIAMVRAGEAGGTLRETLAQLAAMLRRAASIRSEIISSMIYPCILLATAGLTISVIMIFVVPEFEPLFAAADQPQPLAFKLLAGFSQLLRGSIWYVPFVTFGLWPITRKIRRDPNILRGLAAANLRLPFIGTLFRSIEIERLCRILGTLIQNGVEVPVALNLAAGSVANVVIADAIKIAARGLREGGRLTERLARTNQFPEPTINLIKLGEEAGRLPEMLLQQADILQKTIHDHTSRLLTLLVPAITLLLGCVVAGIVTTLLTAILSVNNLAQQ